MKRNKALPVMLSFTSALCMMFGTTACDKGELSYRETHTEDGEKGYMVRGIGSADGANLVIPSMFNDCPVIGIAENAFIGNPEIQSVVIPEGVTVIEDWAVAHCDNLTSIVIPDSVTSIGDSVFSGCKSLMSILIPESVTSIRDWTFSNCSSLMSILIPDSVTSIGKNAFAGCSSLTSIIIPDSVTGIGEYAFYYCSSLESAVIPDSVTEIGSEAFAFCGSLTEITYKGTKAEWIKITKGSNWARSSGKYSVHCADGTLTIGESQDKDSGVYTAYRSDGDVEGSREELR